MAAVVLVVAALTTTILGSEVARQSQRLLEAGVQSQLHTHAGKVRSIMAEVERDLHLLHSLPAMQALTQARVLADGGLDPASIPQRELESISDVFRGLLLSRPHYLQLRLLNANSSGTEMVRFERPHFDWPIRQASELQHKSHRPYFQAALKQPPSEVWIGSPSLNREFAQLQEPEQPVLRAGISLGAIHTQQIVAVLLINIDADYVLNGGEHKAPSGYLLSVVNRQGEYLLRADGGQRYAFDHGETATAASLIPNLELQLDSQENATQPLILRRNGLLTGMLTFLYGPPEERHGLGLIVQSPIQASNLAVRNILQHSAGTLLGMLVLTGIMTWMFTRSITRPIGDLAQAMQHIELSEPKLPTLHSSAPEIRKLYGSLQQLLQRLHDKQQQLMLSHSELQQFATFASQEIQRPTRAISRQLRIVSDNVQNRLTPDSREALGKVEGMIQRQARLLAAMLKHVQLGRDSVVEVVDLSEVVAGAQEDVADQLDETRASVHILQPLPTIHGYRDQLELLFHNLLKNALQYHLPPSKPIIEIGCTSIGPGHWEFSFCDNGPGIAPDDMDHIFSVFHRGSNASATRGAGVGLASCRKVVTLHHGEIHIAKSSHPGACFHFTLKDLNH